MTGGRPRPDNIAVLLREVFVALNDRALTRLAERGPRRGPLDARVVFQYLDETGTTVSTLAERAQMTNQAMAELVGHLQAHGYVVREPDPGRPPGQAGAPDRARPRSRRHRPNARCRRSTN